MELRGKVIVVTGASSGFGKGAAFKFAEAGASLVLAARRHDLLEELAAACRDQGVRAIACTTDVSVRADVKHLCGAAVAEFGRIDVWINDAGVGALGRFDEIPLDDHVQVIETNLLGVLYGSYFALRRFRDQGEGILINIASALGKFPAPYYSSYVASKHGVVGLSGALWQELKEAGQDRIHVCTVMPMAMDTPFFDHAAVYTGHEPVPLPPVYDEEKVVDTIVRLASKPEKEVIVGAAGKLLDLVHGVAPKLTERAMAKHTHKAMIEKAPRGEDSPGNVHQPVPTGTGVSGGRKKD